MSSFTLQKENDLSRSAEDEKRWRHQTKGVMQDGGLMKSAGLGDHLHTPLHPHPRSPATTSEHAVPSSRPSGVGAASRWNAPEQRVVFRRRLHGVVTVAVTLRNEASQLAEALHAFHHDGHAVPHPLPQAHPPAVRDDADQPHGEAVRWRNVGVSHRQAGDDPDVSRPNQSGLGCHGEQVLSFFMRAVDQQNLSVYLLEQPPRSHVVQAVGRHVEGQHVLQLPFEVTGVYEGLDVIHVGFVAGVQAGDDHKVLPVVLLHYLEHAVDLLLDGGTQLQEVGAFALKKEGKEKISSVRFCLLLCWNRGATGREEQA